MIGPSPFSIVGGTQEALSRGCQDSLQLGPAAGGNEPASGQLDSPSLKSNHQ